MKVWKAGYKTVIVLESNGEFLLFEDILCQAQSSVTTTGGIALLGELKDQLSSEVGPGDNPNSEELALLMKGSFVDAVREYHKRTGMGVRETRLKFEALGFIYVSKF